MKALRIVLLLIIASVVTSLHAQITISVSGVISDGADTSGVFGPPGADLTGKPYSIVFHFDPKKGTPTQSCTYSFGSTENADVCQSSISGSGTAASPGTAILTIDAQRYVFGNETDNTKESFAGMNVDPNSYEGALRVIGADYADDIAVEISPANQHPAKNTNFDWRSSFVQGLLGGSVTASFDIGAGNNDAFGTLSITSIEESGYSCSGTPTLSINNTTGQDPNIVVAYGSTNISLSVSPKKNWYTGTLTYADDGTFDFIPVGAFATDTSGAATITYINKGITANDTVQATVCASAQSNTIPVYDFSVHLDEANTIPLDIQYSQVDDATFSDATALDEAGIQRFFNATGAWLAHFYSDITNPALGGWYDETATGTSDTFVKGNKFSVYCPVAGVCPAIGDEGELAAETIAKNAVMNHVNPEVILATLQKEYGTATNTKQPSRGALNGAMGCNSRTTKTFQSQISCGAQVFNNVFTTPPGRYPYFFPVNAAEKKAYPAGAVTHSIQYSWNPSTQITCNRNVHTDCDLVGFQIFDAATYAQYKYTPFVSTTKMGGGYYAFETIWYNFSTHNWYQ